jgi:hypothetical protein
VDIKKSDIINLKLIEGGTGEYYYVLGVDQDSFFCKRVRKTSKGFTWLGHNERISLYKENELKKYHAKLEFKNYKLKEKRFKLKDGTYSSWFIHSNEEEADERWYLTCRCSEEIIGEEMRDYTP